MKPVHSRLSRDDMVINRLSGAWKESFSDALSLTQKEKEVWGWKGNNGGRKRTWQDISEMSRGLHITRGDRDGAEDQCLAKAKRTLDPSSAQPENPDITSEFHQTTSSLTTTASVMQYFCYIFRSAAAVSVILEKGWKMGKGTKWKGEEEEKRRTRRRR